MHGDPIRRTIATQRFIEAGEAEPVKRRRGPSLNPSHRVAPAETGCHAPPMTILDLSNTRDHRPFLPGLGRPLAGPPERSPAHLAATLGLSPGQLTLGKSAAGIFKSLCQRTLQAGDRVIISEPTPAWVTDAILAQGAVYIDVGRHYDMTLAQSAFQRVREDQNIRMVFLPGTCRFSGVSMTRAGLPAPRPDTLWVWDHTFSAPSRWHMAGQDTLTLVDLAQTAGATKQEAAILFGGHASVWPGPATPKATAFASHVLTHLNDLEQAQACYRDRRAALDEAARSLQGGHFSGTEGPGTLLRHPDLDAERLCERLKQAGVLAGHTTHHRFHGRTFLRLPTHEERPVLMAALRACWTSDRA